MMTRTKSLVMCAVLVVQVLAVACGDDSPTAPSQPATPGVLQVAGQYQITQRDLTNTCGGGQPPGVTGTVTHAPGAGTFTMTDTGGTTFNGTVQNNGDFLANGVFGPDATGQTFTQQLQGRFATSGFMATLSVHATPRNCDFTRNWTATKQGSPNVIPGP